MKKNTLFVVLFFSPAAGLLAQNEFDLTGIIHRDDTLGVEGVEVQCSNCPQSSVVTDANGVYTFEGLTTGTSYTLAPKKTDGISEGLTVLDLIKIREYILFLEPLANPTRHLAADVNGSGGITTFDLVLIARVINGASDHFPLDSWTFLPAERTVDSLPASAEDANFVAIKMGDVVREDEVPFASVHPVFAFPLVQADAPGPVMTGMVVYGFSQIEGFQMSLSWDPDVLAFNEISSAILPGFNDSYYFLETPGKLNIAYISGSQITLADGQQILDLDFTVLNPAGPTAIQLHSEGIPFQVVAQGLKLVQDPLISSAHEAIDDAAFRISAGPNPAFAGQSAHLLIESDRPLEVQGLLTTVLGEEVWTNRWKVPAGVSGFACEMPAHPGIYFLRLWAPGAGMQVIRWVVE